MVWAGAATLIASPQLLNVTVLDSPVVVSVSLTGSTLGVAVRTSVTLIGVFEPLGVVFQVRMYTFCPLTVVVLTLLTCEAAGRMLDGSAGRVFSVARSWYSLVPDLIATQWLPTLAAEAAVRPM